MLCTEAYNHYTYFECCGKRICDACCAETNRALKITNSKRKEKDLPLLEESCAFCRTIYECEDEISHLEKRVQKGDVDAMVNLAFSYADGDHGLIKNDDKRLELLRSNKPLILAMAPHSDYLAITLLLIREHLQMTWKVGESISKKVPKEVVTFLGTFLLLLKKNQAELSLQLSIGNLRLRVVILIQWRSYGSIFINVWCARNI